MDCVISAYKLDFLAYPVYLSNPEFVKKSMQYNLNPLQLKINKAKSKNKMKGKMVVLTVYVGWKISVFAYMAVLF